MTSSVPGSWAVVTGASSGLGAEFARQLAVRGAHLVLTARSDDKLAALARRLSAAHHVETEVVAGDLEDPEGVARVCERIDRLGTPIDHLINNAGFGKVGAFVRADPRVNTRMVRLNCEALMLLTHHFLPRMVARERGGIIHVASTASHQPVPYMATYGASKAFVLSFSLALSEELRDTKVTVSAFCPGPVPTGFQEVAGIPPNKMRAIADLTPEQAVTRALAAYDAGDDMCVPGAINSVQTLSSKLLPRGLITRSVAVAMRRMGRT